VDRKIFTKEALTIGLTVKSVRVADKPVRLTRREADLACYLAEHAGRWVSNAELLEKVCKLSKADESLVRGHVYKLRAKLGAAGDTIETQRGFGYRLPGGETAESIETYRKAYELLMEMMATVDDRMGKKKG